MAKKEELEADIENCKVKIARAEELLNGLGGEKERWGEQKDILEKEMYSIVQDMMISSAIISYLGPYTQKYRQVTIEKWRLLMI
jgi:dynein heavy chain, axonemal